MLHLTTGVIRSGLIPAHVAMLISASVGAQPALAQQVDAAGAGLGLVVGLMIAVVVGAIVGWLAGLIVKGGGSAFLGNALYGIGGSVLANLVLPALGVSLGGGWLGPFVAAVFGAVALILIVRLTRKAAA